MTKSKTGDGHPTPIERVRDLVAEEVLDLSDSEIEDEVRALGQAPAARAAAARASVAGLLESVAKKRMEAARAKRLRRTLNRGRFDGLGLEQLQALRARAMAHPNAAGMTSAFREGKSESESDLRAVLESLADLGLLPDEAE